MTDTPKKKPNFYIKLIMFIERFKMLWDDRFDIVGIDASLTDGFNLLCVDKGVKIRRVISSWKIKIVVNLLRFLSVL
jgi:hypothetical protein